MENKKEIQEKVFRKLDLIQKIEEVELAKFPTFKAYVDGGDSIELDETTYLSYEKLQRIFSFCKENNLTFSVVSSENDKTLRSGWMQVSLYESDEESKTQ